MLDAAQSPANMLGEIIATGAGISPQGRYMIYLSNQRDVKAVANDPTAEPLTPFSIPRPGQYCAVPDENEGNVLVLYAIGGAGLWNLRTGKVVTENTSAGTFADPKSVTFDPKGEFIMTLSWPGDIRFLDRRDLKPMKLVDTTGLPSPSYSALSADGEVLAYITSSAMVTTWERKAGPQFVNRKTVSSLPGEVAPITGIAFLGGGHRYLAVARGKQVVWIDLTAGPAQRGG
jgi:hypothetical protein